MQSRSFVRCGIVAHVVASVVGCTDTRTVQETRPPSGCYECHGAAENGNVAPPPVIWRDPAVADAHPQHLQANDVHAAIPCETCHVVPQTTDDPGHIDTELPAELTFTGLAVADTTTPTYDAEQRRCSGTYCHGAKLAGGGNPAPVWTGGDAEAQCNSCHGDPPSGTHPNADRCSLCHPAVIDEDRHFIAPASHVNGTVEAIGQDCDSCHGSGGDPAPPKDLAGNTATTAAGVGAHRQHLATSNWHKTVLCADCHVQPATVDEAGHLGDAPADLVWGALAGTDSASPNYDATSHTCSGVYCHGATIPQGGGNRTAPDWTDNGHSQQQQCGGCHASPPGGTHPQVDTCEVCHGSVVDAQRNFVAPELHIDGVVDVACDTCHGGNGVAAPPKGLAGETDITTRAVGAHRQHLDTSTWHATMACSECHVVPAAIDSPGHRDNSRATVTLGALAKTDSPSADYDDVALSCSAVYCHGGGMQDSGGSVPAPVWTEGGHTEVEQCGGCHSLPPLGTHAPRSDCATCHPAVVDSGRNIIDAAKHINGVADVLATLACNGCHGNAAGSPTVPADVAPPVDVSNGSDAARVGAHQAHLRASDWHAPLLCSDCHAVPATTNAAGHLGQPPADVSYVSYGGTCDTTNNQCSDDTDRYCCTRAIGGNCSATAWGNNTTTDADCDLAGYNGYDWAGPYPPAPSYASGTCSNVYCHGARLKTGFGGANTAPSWTGGPMLVSSPPTAADCGTCHGYPPGGSPHPPNANCSQCHQEVVGCSYFKDSTSCQAQGCNWTVATSTCSGTCGGPLCNVTFKQTGTNTYLNHINGRRNFP
ncbi:MAG: CxxxxCH/CxxCH domain-containing protein [Deltaproteobacteria bacterium]|nr:CxxxxCH/CxxCH domain-containing protein [Deltaproteobacteria bacterium]